MSDDQDLSHFSMLDLLRIETGIQVVILTENLLALEANPESRECLEPLMRAAHSVKGAARIVDVEAAVKVAHVMEDCFVAAQQGTVILARDEVDLLLQGVDFLQRLAEFSSPEQDQQLPVYGPEVEKLVAAISGILSGQAKQAPVQREITNPLLHSAPGVPALRVADTLPPGQLLIAGAPLTDLPFTSAPLASASPAIPTSHVFDPGGPLPTAGERQLLPQESDASSTPQGVLPSAPPRQGVLSSGQSLKQDVLRSEPSPPQGSLVSQSPLPPEQSAHLQIAAPPYPHQGDLGATRTVRVSAENLNRLMGLAGESLVGANWLEPFADSLLKLRNRQAELSNTLEGLQALLVELPLDHRAQVQLDLVQQQANECRQLTTARLAELELFAHRSLNLSDRLYREVIASHMRPFSDGVQAFPRMVRDLARQLGKHARLEILGRSTPVDRDIMEKLEAPLTHLLRNAVDHGIETPAERLAAGKPEQGIIWLEASHRAGMLSIIVSDDGAGVDLDRLRQKVVSRNLVKAETAAGLTEGELLEFLFLPGFSTAAAITEISGRGVGMDVVRNMVNEVRGSIRTVSQPGKGLSVHLQLPLTLSVIPTLLVEIGGEPYAFPLSRVDRIARVPQEEIALVENRQYFTLEGENIGLVAAHQVLELDCPSTSQEMLPVIVISDRLCRYGLVVDRFLGEKDLVVRPLDPRLGKIQDISAAALSEEGGAILIVDVEDIVRSIDNLLQGRRLGKMSAGSNVGSSLLHNRILVVDDSITVREMERKLLENHGYEVEVAVNGMDGWNAIRTGHYDLVVTDIDMPRMNGIEMISQIRENSSTRLMPVIIVSYKDNDEDRLKGLEVGADYYLTKSSYHDETLLHAVIALIGEAP